MDLIQRWTDTLFFKGGRREEESCPEYVETAHIILHKESVIVTSTCTHHTFAPIVKQLIIVQQQRIILHWGKMSLIKYTHNYLQILTVLYLRYCVLLFLFPFFPHANDDDDEDTV